MDGKNEKYAIKYPISSLCRAHAVSSHILRSEELEREELARLRKECQTSGDSIKIPLRKHGGKSLEEGEDQGIAEAAEQ